MKQRFKLYQRSGTYYKRDTETGARLSLKTGNLKEATAIIEAENVANNNPAFGQEMARVLLVVRRAAFSCFLAVRPFFPTKRQLIFDLGEYLR